VTSDSGLDLTAFRNRDGSVAIVALNTGTAADPVAIALHHLGVRRGATATPYLTDAASDTAAQPPVPLPGGTLRVTLPARSLTTFVIG
jgi:glucuronoarabinoxylan endo-1,4-beta-xylanase